MIGKKRVYQNFYLNLWVNFKSIFLYMVEKFNKLLFDFFSSEIQNKVNKKIKEDFFSKLIFYTKQKHPITLIEVMFVIFFIALLSGLFSIPITRAYQEQKFRNDVHRLLQQLRLAQDLNLLFHANMTLTIANAPDESGYLYNLSSDVILPKKWESILDQQKGTLSYIDKITLISSTPSLNEIKIKFNSGGSLNDDGDLILSDKNEKKRFIHLPGYPALITSSSTLKNNTEQKNELKQDEELTRELQKELQKEIHSEN